MAISDTSQLQNLLAKSSGTQDSVSTGLLMKVNIKVRTGAVYCASSFRHDS